MKRVDRAIDSFNRLSSNHKSFLTDFESNCNRIIDLIDKNQEVLMTIIQDAEDMFENAKIESDEIKKLVRSFSSVLRFFLNDDF